MHSASHANDSHLDQAPELSELVLIEEGAELPPPLEGSTTASPSDDAQTKAHTSPTTISLQPHPLRERILLPILLIPFSILGLLVRLGLVYIETFSGQQVFALAWPQFVGCVLMGLFVSTRAWIEQGMFLRDPKRSGHWIGSFIYVGLASGLCGSITTFSSWSLATFVELINPNKLDRFPLQNLLSALAELAVTLALSVTGLQVGIHLGENLSKSPPPPPPPPAAAPTGDDNSAGLEDSPGNTSTVVVALPIPPPYWTVLDILLITVCVCVWLGMIFAVIWMPLSSYSSWRHVVFAAVFAPPGAMIRWYLSRFNSSKSFHQFPIGTFTVNVGGSAILAAVVCLQHTPMITGNNTAACQVLSGLQDGFCGCLTTISTFALELRVLSRRGSYFYGLVSVVAAQVCMLLILGSFVWTRHGVENQFQTSQCQM